MNAFRPEKWIKKEFESDFATLLHAALGLNDQLRIDLDHVEYTGGMNQVEAFRELVNQLHYKWRDYV